MTIDNITIKPDGAASVVTINLGTHTLTLRVDPNNPAAPVVDALPVIDKKPDIVPIAGSVVAEPAKDKKRKGLPTKNGFMYNLMLPDGNGYPDANGVYKHDKYGTVDYDNNPAYVLEWPCDEFSLMVPMGQYIESRTAFRRRVVYENIRRAVEKRDARYVARWNFTWQNINDSILKESDVARFHDGSLAAESGCYMAKLHLLRDYHEGGSKDKDNFWHWATIAYRQFITDFASHLADGRCYALITTLTQRAEEGYGKRYINAENTNLLLSDYSDSSIADFQRRTGIKEALPAPGSYFGDNAFTGKAGLGWSTYREELYKYFKEWAKAELLAIVPGAGFGDDYGQVIGREAMAMGQINYPKWAKNAQVVKFNPSRDEDPNFITDLFRSNVPKGAILNAEFDQVHLLDNPQRKDEKRRDVNALADLANAYFSRGVGVISVGQCGYRSAFEAAVDLAKECIKRGYTERAIAEPKVEATVEYTSKEALYSPDTLPHDRWRAAGGDHDTVVDIKLVDNTSSI